MTKRVLLITMGETPQIVTETVYALLKKEPPWVPDRIILATTGSGESIFYNGRDLDYKGEPLRVPIKPLLGEGGQLKKLYTFLKRERDFVAPEIMTAKTPDKITVNDVRSETEIDAFAELVIDLVRDVTANDETELHLSFAGGRKTMSSVTAQILSIFGRPQDVLSHCLVELEKVEKSDDFWWPGSNPEIDTANAKVLLHESPYVRFRASISETEAIRNRTLTFQQIVESANNALSARTITLDLVNYSLLVGNKPIPFQTDVNLKAATKGQMRNLIAISTILVATKLGWQINRKKLVKGEGLQGIEHPTLLNNSIRQFERVLAINVALCHPELLNDNWDEGKIPDTTRNTDGFLTTEAIFAASELPPKITDKSFEGGVSGLRRQLIDSVSHALAEKIIRPTKKVGKKAKKVSGEAQFLTWETGFVATEIEIILPPGLSMSVYHLASKSGLNTP